MNSSKKNTEKIDNLLNQIYKKELEIFDMIIEYKRIQIMIDLKNSSHVQVGKNSLIYSAINGYLEMKKTYQNIS